MNAQCAGTLNDGGRCPFNISKVIGGVALCERHEISVKAVILQENPSQLDVVYYLFSPDLQQIKIGTSCHIRSRIKKHRQTSPSVIVVATEPGSYALESQRHREFAYLCVDAHKIAIQRTEWHYIDNKLLSHIKSIREEFGILSTLKLVKSELPVQWTYPCD